MDVPGPVSIALELFSEEIIRVSGNGANVVLYGDATFVEDVS